MELDGTWQVKATEVLHVLTGGVIPVYTFVCPGQCLEDASDGLVQSVCKHELKSLFLRCSLNDILCHLGQDLSALPPRPHCIEVS